MYSLVTTSSFLAAPPFLSAISPLAPGAGGGIRLGGVPRRRERKTLPDTGVAFYRSCTQNDVATWAGWCSGPLLGPSRPGERLWGRGRYGQYSYMFGESLF